MSSFIGQWFFSSYTKLPVFEHHCPCIFSPTRSELTFFHFTAEPCDVSLFPFRSSVSSSRSQREFSSLSASCTAAIRLHDVTSAQSVLLARNPPTIASRPSFADNNSMEDAETTPSARYSRRVDGHKQVRIQPCQTIATRGTLGRGTLRSASRCSLSLFRAFLRLENLFSTTCRRWAFIASASLSNSPIYEENNFFKRRL